MIDSTNLLRIKIVNDALEELASNVVYVGGATVSMYIDRPATEARITDDIDILIELTTYYDYAAIEEKLRRKGFENDINSSIICRYIIKGIIVDIMPTEEKILGFSNRWYSEGLKATTEYSLNSIEKIKIFTPIYLLASKLDAFNNRGNNDGRTSSDFEDIIYILNNRNKIWDELENAPFAVKNYLKQEFTNWLDNKYIEEWISAHLDYNEQRRVYFIIERLGLFTNSR